MSNITNLAPASGSTVTGTRQHPRSRDLLRGGRVSIHFFVVRIAFFALGVVAMPFAIGDVVIFWSVVIAASMLAYVGRGGLARVAGPAAARMDLAPRNLRNLVACVCDRDRSCTRRC